MRTKILLCLLITCAGAGSSVQAELLASETFDYQAGASLARQKGGTGWASPWAGKEPVISDESITYSKYGVVRGGGAVLMVTSNGEDTFSRDVYSEVDQSGADIYVSFIFQVKGPAASKPVADEVFAGWRCKDSSREIAVDNIGFTGLRGRAGARVNSVTKSLPSPLQFGVTYFMVIKYGDWNGLGYTSTTIWLNPRPDEEETGDADIKVRATSNKGSDGFRGVQVRTIGLSPQAFYLIDDLCVGKSWSDVTAPSLAEAP